MAESVTLTASDGHRLNAWLARPAGKPRGGVIVLQEIFGVNKHIRRVTEGFAAQGFLAIAPAMFDRVRTGVELGYTDFQPGRDLVGALEIGKIVLDLTAATRAVASAGKVGAVGYCWGGALADLAACESPVSAAVSYYGRHTLTWLERKPKCPVMYHWAKLDPVIPPAMMEEIRAGRPAGEHHVYDAATHGFNCDDRHEFHPASAALALERTLDFFSRHLS
ncbi:MAG: dienelactone hydrolase family protein [Gammaproteobacteria bacterium]|nr:dienelactone hydrolase family protein [Gammaproteobacteria bacterium]